MFHRHPRLLLLSYEFFDLYQYRDPSLRIFGLSWLLEEWRWNSYAQKGLRGKRILLLLSN